MKFNESDRLVKWGVLIFGAILCFQVSWSYRKLQNNLRVMRELREHGRPLETAFKSLRASAKAGKCDSGMWEKVIWADSAKAESPGVVQPVGIEVKPTLCAALADEKWTPDQLGEYGENGMVGVWRKAYPSTGFSGVIVMYAKRPAPDQPYEVTHWGAYPRLDGALRLQKGSE